MLVSVEQLKKETNQDKDNANKAKRKPREKATDAVVAEEAAVTPLIRAITEGNILGKDVNLEKRKEMIAEKGFEPTEFGFERAIGKNDSLYSNFSELIALTKRKVGRIVVKEDGKKLGYATGFMVSDKLMLTNWHVFENKEMAEESELHFFYEYDAQGHPGTPVIFKFNTTHFYNNEALDYCFVAVQPTDVTGKESLASIGYLYLDKGLGKIGDKNVERLNIIHHPQGDFKQISIRENLFVDIDKTKIFYETDTAQGSSGSPVFNDQWQVVGLHHRSVAKMSEDGKNYLDKDDKVIPVIDKKIDVTRVVWLKNEGMRISVILNHLAEKNPDDEVVAGLGVPPPPENLTFTINSGDNFYENKNNTTMSNESNKNITINVPVNALSTESSIEISLSSKKINQGSNISTGTAFKAKTATDEQLNEIAKIDKENAIDFSDCKGYNPKFLGTSIALPQPKKSIEKQIARMANNQTELKYYKYSVIFNAVTKLPLISAINVEGDAEKRKDDSKRSDDWLRDSRIDIECQLTDKFYAASKMDKGHMSRWEDANWDDTIETANRNGVFTCFYTNACPQVPKLNRAGGFWGKLETAILQKGILKEKGKLARMTVFNGPIFDDTKNRIYKGETIPMEFFKIILWIGDDKKLKATGFKLTQELLVKGVKFDESMGIAEEALDIDKSAVFKEFRCSIKRLGQLTKIDFKHLESYDTFKGNDNDEMLLENDETLIL
jgi:endonuclease G